MKILKIVTLTLLIGVTPSYSFAHGDHAEPTDKQTKQQKGKRATASEHQHGSDGDGGQDTNAGNTHRHGTDDTHDDKDGE